MNLPDVLEPVCFPVVERPIWHENSAKNGLGETDRFKALVREDTGELISVVSNRYEVIQASNYFERFFEMLDRHALQHTVRQASVTGDNTRFFVDITLPEISHSPSDGYPILYRIVIGGSYDRSSGFWFKSGAFRMVCSNGMIIGSIDYRFSQPHKGDTEPLFWATEKAIMDVSENGQEALTSSIDGLVNSRFVNGVDPYTEEFMEERFSHLPKKLVETIHRDGDFSSPWTLYNSFTNAVSNWDRGGLALQVARQRQIHSVFTNPEVVVPC